MHKMLAHRNGRIGVLVLATLVVLVAATLWLIGADGRNNPASPGVPHNQSGAPPSGGSNDPDPVKQETGPNGDIRPSPTGTGPGSDRSLLGPQE